MHLHFAIVLVVLLVGHVCYADKTKYIACPTETITQEASIESPLYPEYPAYFYCEYIFQAPEGYYVTVDFQNFQFPTRSSPRRGINVERIFPMCEENFVEISDGVLDDVHFRYCGRELEKKKFHSRGRTLMLTLQAMNVTDFVQGGFRASITFKRKNTGAFAVKCEESENNMKECKIPLRRRMTPESSVELFVTRRQSTVNCTKRLIVTKERVQHLEKSNEINLEDLFQECSSTDKKPQYFSLGDRNSIFYKVNKDNMEQYDFAIGNYSTKQLEICGGVIKMEARKKYKVKYSGRNWPHDQTCLWIIHADRRARQITVEIDNFDFGGKPQRCDHHLSMMYISRNMFELIDHEPNLLHKSKAICKEIEKSKKLTKRFARPNREIYGGLSIMMLLSHSPHFKTLSAEVSCI